MQTSVVFLLTAISATSLGASSAHSAVVFTSSVRTIEATASRNTDASVGVSNVSTSFGNYSHTVQQLVPRPFGVPGYLVEASASQTSSIADDEIVLSGRLQGSIRADSSGLTLSRSTLDVEFAVDRQMTWIATGGVTDFTFPTNRMLATVSIRNLLTNTFVLLPNDPNISFTGVLAPGTYRVSYVIQTGHAGLGAADVDRWYTARLQFVPAPSTLALLVVGSMCARRRSRL